MHVQFVPRLSYSNDLYDDQDDEIPVRLPEDDAGGARQRDMLARMGIRHWFAKIRRSEDDAAVRHAEEELRSGSAEEREGISGDIESLGANDLAERRPGESSVRDSGRLRGL